VYALFLKHGEGCALHYGRQKYACSINRKVFLLLTELSRSSGATRDVQPLPEVLTQYLQLIECHFSEKHQVAEYASQLGISPNYLNVLCRKHLGLSALRMIMRLNLI